MPAVQHPRKPAPHRSQVSVRAFPALRLATRSPTSFARALISRGPDLRYVQAYQALRAQLDPSGQAKLRQEADTLIRTVRSQCGIGPPDSGKMASQAAIPCVLQRYLAQRDLLLGRLTGPAAEEAARPLEAHTVLQANLKALGFLPSDSVVDGVYGPATRTAIIQWQQSRGRALTGFLGNSDAALLEQQAASVRSQPSLGASAQTETARPGNEPASPVTSAPSLPATATEPATIPPPRRLELQLDSDGGVLTVPVIINEAIKLDFIVDSGASDVSIPADVVQTLMRARTIDSSDFIGDQTYQTADGRTTPAKTFRIRSLRIADRTLHDVTASVAPSEGPLLLGQSFLGRFRSWSIDNERKVLVVQ